MVDQVGLWAGTGTLCALMVLLIIFAIYKQHFGTLALPPRKPEAKPGEKTDDKTQDKTERAKDMAAEDSSVKPSPGVDGQGAHVYEQAVDDSADSADIAVEVHGTEATCAGGPPESSPPYVYDQAIQLETST